MTKEIKDHGNPHGTHHVPPGGEVLGAVKNYKVEVVVRRADGSVREKRVETVSKAV